MDVRRVFVGVCLKLRDIALCAIVKAEMYTGSAKSQTRVRSRQLQEDFFQRFVSLPFTDQSALLYGNIRADLEKRGQTIGGNDLFIAAIALEHDMILVTHNTREFERIPDLKIEDWEN